MPDPAVNAVTGEHAQLAPLKTHVSPASQPVFDRLIVEPDTTIGGAPV